MSFAKKSSVGGLLPPHTMIAISARVPSQILPMICYSRPEARERCEFRNDGLTKLVLLLDAVTDLLSALRRDKSKTLRFDTERMFKLWNPPIETYIHS